jgi:electron transport complex protein RnfG
MRSATRALAIALPICAALLGAIAWATRAHIVREAHRHELAMLASVLPPDAYDNDPLTDRTTRTQRDAFGTDAPVTVLRGRLAGQPSAVVVEAVAPGYAGPIRLLVGVRYDGGVAGVRIVEHAETPGLGDRFDTDRGAWLATFRGRGDDARWAVKKDGGDFDQFAGATITPRAIVAAVGRVRAWCAANRDALFADAPP